MDAIFPQNRICEKNRAKIVNKFVIFGSSEKKQKLAIGEVARMRIYVVRMRIYLK